MPYYRHLFVLICSDLKHNRIAEIHPDAFVPLKSLVNLYVYSIPLGDPTSNIEYNTNAKWYCLNFFNFISLNCIKSVLCLVL